MGICGGVLSAVLSTVAAGIPAAAESLEVAAKDDRVLASPDLAADDRFDPDWHALTAEAGFRALLAVPVLSPRMQRFGNVNRPLVDIKLGQTGP